MIFKAIEFAAGAHAGQYRKGTNIAYIVHPLGVAKILIEYGSPDHMVMAGILHDTIEDTPVTLEQIKEIFGSPDSANGQSNQRKPEKAGTPRPERQ